MGIMPSAEDYLEIILLLSKKAAAIRSIDVVKETGYSRPSVSIAIRKLRDQGLIGAGADGSISLTPDGIKKAQTVYDRHAVLYGLLISIGVNEKAAAADACKMEHVLSSHTFEAFKKLYEQNAKT